MNILFITRLYPDSRLGGIERVTQIISREMSRDGHAVYVLYSQASEFDGSCSWLEYMCITNGAWNTSLISECLEKYGITHIINQSCFAYTSMIRKAIGARNIQLITCVHGAPHFKALRLNEAINQTNNKLKQTLIRMMYPLYKWASVYKLRQLHRRSYDLSDWTVMLSASNLSVYKAELNIDGRKLNYINNPLSFATNILQETLEAKDNICLVVCRLNDPLKRIHLVLRAWQVIEQRHKDWKLQIVGDGELRNVYENEAKDLGLRNIDFVGNVISQPFYEKAKIYLMTSESEGWGMTLTESLQNGVLPVAMNSFASLHDIIEDGTNGFIVENEDLNAFVQRVEQLIIADTVTLLRLQQQAIESTNRFSIDLIMEKWYKLLSER